MCEPASFVITKEKIYWSKNSESHEVIIKENDLKDVANVRGEPNLVRVEISPPDMDFRLPIKDWIFKFDRQNIPKWFFNDDAEKTVRKELKEWIRAKVVLPDQKIKEIKSGQIIACYGKIKYVGGSAVIKDVRDSAVIQDVRDSAVIQNVRDSAVIQNVRDSAVIQDVGESAVIQYVGGSAVIKDVRGSAVIKYVSGSAVIQYIRDSAVIQDVGESAVIQYVSGSAVIQDVRGSAVIIAYNSLTPDILKSSKAVLINRSKDTVVCYVGKD